MAAGRLISVFEGIYPQIDRNRDCDISKDPYNKLPCNILIAEFELRQGGCGSCRKLFRIKFVLFYLPTDCGVTDAHSSGYFASVPVGPTKQIINLIAF